MTIATYRSPNGQTFQLHANAGPVVEPFFNRLNQIYPDYKSAGGYAHRPMRTLDGRNLGGLSTHATGYTLDVKAPDHVLRQMHQEFPHLKWGGKFSHYDPVHFEFGPTAQKHGELPPLNPASLLDPKAAAPVAGPGPQPIAGGAAPMTPTTPITPYDGMMPADVQKHRKLAQMLAGQATDASPVGHWTQALARVVQGGVGGMHDRAATEGERQGQASIAEMMAGNPSPQAMMANPYTMDMGKQLWLAQAKSKIQGPEEFGKSGAIFQAPDGQFYSMQFGSRGERVVKPVEANGKPLTPAKGVTTVGDELINNATGAPVRNVGPQIANQETQQQIGAARGKTIAGAPKLVATQADLERQHGVVNDDIDRAMKEINWTSVGVVGGLLKAVPGTPAYALAQKIATIKANVGFDKLAEMRANSPTGGALGAVTERELAFLQSVFGSLEQAQNADEIRYNLRRLKDYLKDSSASRRKVLELELRNAGLDDAGLTGTVGVRQQVVPPPQPQQQPAPAAPGAWSARRLD